MTALNPGDKVGLITPSSFLPNPECIEKGIDYLRSLGFEVVRGRHLYDSFRYMGGTPEQRAEDIMAFFKDAEIKAIFSTAGGSGSQKILPLLDYDIIKANPKPVLGFSDVTALQLGIYAKTKNPSYTGFTLKYDFKTGSIDPLVKTSLETLLRDEKLTAQGGKTVRGGSAEGILVGGCLSMFRNLCGTAFYPDISNAVLLIEDVSEKTYKVDLMLQQLQQCPNFDKIKGIVFGQFADNIIAAPEDGTVDDTIFDFCKNLNIPVIKDFPYGHVPSRYVLPIGRKCRLDADNCRLEFS